MRTILLLSVIALVCITSSAARDLIAGTSYNARLTWQQKADYIGFPFRKRVKEMFYSDPAQQIIKGVIARETSLTEATVTVTAGGVGFSYVNLRFKSESGGGINYLVEIYV